MKYLLDTDTCVFWLRGRASIRTQLSVVGVDDVSLSVISLAELRFGASATSDSERHHQALDNLVNGLTVLGVNGDVARTFGDLKADLRKHGQLIEDFDLLIASSAITYDLILVTNNLKHFERISNLRIENWA